MPRVSKYAVFHQGLSLGEHVYEFALDDSFFENYGGEIKRGDCKATVTVVKTANLLTLHTVIDGKAQVCCDRCLDDFYMPVCFEGSLIVKFSYDKEGYDFNGVGDSDDDIFWLSPDSDAVDLEEYLYASVYLSLPMQKVHPEGECDPDMLARFVRLADDDDEQ